MVAVAVGAAACQRTRRAPEGRFRAVGTVVLDGVAADDRAGWGTEAEILVSRAAILEVIEKLRLNHTELDPELLRRGASARRRPDTRILELTVRLDDARLATVACNLLLDGYLDRRLGRAHASMDDLERQLSNQLDGLRAALGADAGPDPVADQLYRTTLARLAEVQLSARAIERDAHVLDACSVPRPPRSR